MSGSENPVPDARPAASLTASLLARRGAARPAMRRQPLGSLNVLPINDDLGWNDMGEDKIGEDRLVPSALHSIETVEVPEGFGVPEAFGEAAVADAVSPIAGQIQALAERINAKPVRQTKRPATLTGAGRKAAFTLRIDSERHLRLRLLSAVTNRSAQQLLIEALDALIARNERLRELAERAEESAITADMKWGS